MSSVVRILIIFNMSLGRNLFMACDRLQSLSQSHYPQILFFIRCTFDVLSYDDLFFNQLPTLASFKALLEADATKSSFDAITFKNGTLIFLRSTDNSGLISSYIVI